MKKFLSLGVVVCLLTLAGCDSGSAPAKTSGGVALIDLEVAAKRLGRDTAIDGELKTLADDLGAKLTTAQKDLQKEFVQFKESLGETPTAEETQKLAVRGQELNQKLQREQQAARQKISQKRTDLVVRFREEIRPIALRIAAAKGFSTVLVKSDIVVLANEPGVDITDEVVAEMVGQDAPANAAAETAKPAESPAAADAN